MVTTAPTRPLHPLQSGPHLGFLWLLQATISIIITATAVLLTPVAGRHLVWVNGVLTPDTTLTLGALIALAALISFALIQRTIRRSLDMHIPGRLPTENPPATPAPGLVVAIAGNLLFALAAIYAATHAMGDYGLTKMLLTAMGACTFAALPGRLLFVWARKRLGWRGDLLVTAVDWGMMATAFTITATLAPGGLLHSALARDDNLTSLIIMSAMIAVVIGCWAGAKRQEREAGDEPESFSSFLQRMSHLVVDTFVASPTLRHYRLARRLVTAVVIPAGVILFIVMTVLVFAGEPRMH